MPAEPVGGGFALVGVLLAAELNDEAAGFSSWVGRRQDLA